VESAWKLDVVGYEFECNIEIYLKEGSLKF
jgi:hypothetical protein